MYAQRSCLARNMEELVEFHRTRRENVLVPSNVKIGSDRIGYVAELGIHPARPSSVLRKPSNKRDW